MSETEAERNELSFLGTHLGSTTGWDSAGDFALQFYDVELNSIGKRFLRLNTELAPGTILTIDAENGLVTTWDATMGEEQVTHNPDWSVFNKD